MPEILTWKYFPFKLERALEMSNGFTQLYRRPSVAQRFAT